VGKEEHDPGDDFIIEHSVSMSTSRDIHKIVTDIGNKAKQQTFRAAQFDSVTVSSKMKGKYPHEHTHIKTFQKR